jgi:predicted acyl esterase
MPHPCQLPEKKRALCRPYHVIAALILVGTLAVATSAAEEKAPAEKPQVLPNEAHIVVMRDGTPLATDVYLPTDGEGPWPVILVRTPYGKKEVGAELASAVCGQGYALASQDMRGRFESPGSDSLIFHNDGWSERRDGHDTLEWVARQPWSNGSICTWGASALGITQNMMAPGAPETLKAQHVEVALSDFYAQGAYQGGAPRKALAEGWLEEVEADPTNLETFLQHYRYDQLWEEMNPEAQAHRVNAPAIFWGGWYDIFCQGTINSFVTIHNRGGPGARGRCRLVMGPWAHGSFTAEEIMYPDNGGPDARADALRFFDHWARGVDNGVPDDPPVQYYVMGDTTDPMAPGNYWRAADNWPPPAKLTGFYFHPNGELIPEVKPAGEGKRSYRYDPRDPVPTIGGQNLMISMGPMDQRPVEGREDVVPFTSEELAEPLEVTGHIYATLFISSDCPDTDFTVKLTDVYPDGRSMLVTDGIMRARFRDSFERETFLEPGQVYQVTVDLWSTSLIFNKGHRIRVAVSSSNSPRFDPNPNTGKAPRADDETQIAANDLHLSKRHPSHIVLPIYAGPARAQHQPAG